MSVIDHGAFAASHQRKCGACRDGSTLPFSFTMAFQPIVDLGTGDAWGYEALVRGPAGESAASVLSQVDDTSLYTFDQACRVKAIELAGPKLAPGGSRRLSINFKPNAVYEPAACIRATLAAAAKVDLAPNRLMFEFTEDERMRDVGHVRRIVAEYRRLGFLTAIDDFGAGYAGLTLLADLSPDLIKLDMSLIRDIDSSASRRAIVAATIQMAKSLNILVLAEGVETQAEARTLRDLGISLCQGYFFAKPQIDRLPDVALELA